MNVLKDKLNEMNYDMTAIIHSNYLKKVLGGSKIDDFEEKEINTSQVLNGDPICRERAIKGEEP